MKHRKLVVASILLLILVAGAAAALSLYGIYSASASASVSEALNSIPGDYQFVMGFNVQRLVTSPLYARLQKESPQTLPLESDLAAFTEQTGIDPTRDISSMLIAARSGEQAKPQGLVIVSGDFDRNKITSYVRTQASPDEMEYGGAPVMLVPDKKDLSVKNGIAFLGEHEIAMGNLESLKAALDTRAGTRKNIRSNATVAALLDGMDLDEMFWFAGDAAGALKQSTLPVPVGLNTSSIQSVAGTFNLSENISGKISVLSNDAESATKLADVFRGIMALGQLSGNQNPDLKSLLSGITVAQNASQITLSVNFPGDLLKKLEAARDKRTGSSAVTIK